MEDLLHRALGESIYIRTQVQDGLWNTLIDVPRLENVILNIAINARDAMDHRGTLTMDLANATVDERTPTHEKLVAGDFVTLAITDTGSGMTPEVQRRAFEPFFTTKPEGEGTGLGLSMVYGFMKQSGGHVTLYSEAGQGTTIRLYLPRCDEPVDEAAVAPAAAPMRRQRRDDPRRRGRRGGPRDRRRDADRPRLPRAARARRPERADDHRRAACRSTCCSPT